MDTQKNMVRTRLLWLCGWGFRFLSDSTKLKLPPVAVEEALMMIKVIISIMIDDEGYDKL